MDIRELHQVDS